MLHRETSTRAFEIAMERCSTDHAPRYVIPAEERWFRDVAVAQLVHDTLEVMDPKYPQPGFDPAEFSAEALGREELGGDNRRLISDRDLVADKQDELVPNSSLVQSLRCNSFTRFVNVKEITIEDY